MLLLRVFAMDESDNRNDIAGQGEGKEAKAGATLEHRLSHLETSVSKLETSVGDMPGVMVEVSRQLKELSQKINALSGLPEEVKQLRREVRRTQRQYDNLRENLREFPPGRSGRPFNPATGTYGYPAESLLERYEDRVEMTTYDY